MAWSAFKKQMSNQENPSLYHKEQCRQQWCKSKHWARNQRAGYFHKFDAIAHFLTLADLLGSGEKVLAY